VLGHTKYKGVQRVYCNPFPKKTFYGSHRMDPVIIRPPGIDHGAFVVSPETVWYARVLLLFSASAMTDIGSKSFDCALVSTLEIYDDPENGNVYYTHYSNYVHYNDYFTLISCRMVGVCWIACGIRAQLQKADPVRRSHSEYSGQTSLGACR
jgi:hypothetical protein